MYVFEAGLQSAHFQRRAAMLAVFAACGTLEACGGNSEQCIARWQALLEFNTNTPDTIAKKPLDTRLKFFEAFWESDAPRVGDVEGGGWSVWLAQKMSGQEAADHVTSSWEAVPDVFLALPTEPQVWGVLGTDETAVAPEDTPAVVGAPGSVSVAAASDSAPVVDTDTRVEMVYSALHGYRIPMRVEVEGEEGTTTSGYYKRILGELREENGSDAAALAKAQKAAAKILKPSPLSPDDPLVMCTWPSLSA
ncbi:MAG: hypothetical protein P4L40_00755 [Terracidiphilus sp.]|nr:hypothetical protein [Terracidiphilus sp.]